MTIWTHPPANPIPDPSSVNLHLAFLNLSPSPSELQETLALLPPEEQQTARQFRFPTDTHRYAAAHAALRRILSRYTGLAPARIPFQHNPHGKPELAQPHDPIRFNLSHSGSHALIGITRNRRIGVDLEVVRTDLNTDELSSHWFSSREQADLASLPPTTRTRAFFDCWTRKEAFVKACGLGLSLPLDQFDVSCLPGTPPSLLANRHSAEETGAWTIHAPPVPTSLAAAIAVEGRDLHFHYWRETGPGTVRS